MRRMMVILSLCLICGLVAATMSDLSEAQEDVAGTGTPSLCATPQGTPGTPAGTPGTPVGTPEIITEGSPEAIATSVVEHIATGLESVVCATPMQGSGS